MNTQTGIRGFIKGRNGTKLHILGNDEINTTVEAGLTGTFWLKLLLFPSFLNLILLFAVLVFYFHFSLSFLSRSLSPLHGFIIAGKVGSYLLISHSKKPEHDQVTICHPSPVR